MAKANETALINWCDHFCLQYSFISSALEGFKPITSASAQERCIFSVNSQYFYRMSYLFSAFLKTTV